MANRYCNVNGNDSWDGTAQTHQGGSVGPWLTANYALDQMALSSNDGNTIIFGDGTFTYSNNAGRAIFSHAAITIDCENAWATTLIFDGTNSQGLRFNADTAGSEERTVTVGNIYIKSSGVGKGSQVVFSGNSAACQRMTVNWGARTVPPDSASGAVIGISIEASKITFNTASGAGCVGTSAVVYRPVNYSSSLTVVDIDINITEYYFDLTCELSNNNAAIMLESNNAITGTWLVSGVTGTIHDTGSSAGAVYGVRISKGPNGSTIENCNNLTITIDAPASRTCTLFSIEAISSSGITTESPAIKNNKGCVVNADNGILAVIGGEGSDHLTPDGVIEGNSFIVNPTSPTFGMHGVCHIGCLGGVRRNNRVDGASIGSLTKLGTAISHDNYYRNVGGSSNVFLYAKGAENSGDKTKFINEVCEIPNGFTGIIEQCLEDNASGQDSIDVEFRGTKVIRLGSNNISSSANLHVTGSGTDTSTSTSAAMVIDDAITLPTTVASVAGTTYASLALANATATIAGMWQADTRLLQSNIGAVGIARVGVPCLQIATGVVIPLQ